MEMDTEDFESQEKQNEVSSNLPLLSCRYKGNFHSGLQCNFQKLLHCHCVAKNATWLHGVPAKFANRKIARIFRAFNFSAIFQKLLYCWRQTLLYFFMCNSRTIFLEIAISLRVKLARVAALR